MNDYPAPLLVEVNKFLKEHEGSKVFHYDCITGTPYKDKTITSDCYRVYILYGNLFVLKSFTICSNPDWNFNEVRTDSMNAWEIQMCYEKSGWPGWVK